MPTYYGSRVTAGMISTPFKSVILRKLYKDKNADITHQDNVMMDYQEVLSDIDLVIWLYGDKIETAVRQAIEHPEQVTRYGALCLGESTHLIDRLHIIKDDIPEAQTFLLDPRGRFSFPIVPDYETNAKARYATGNIVPVKQPEIDRLPIIA